MRINITRSNNPGGKGFSSGKNAVAIDHRSGFKRRYSEMKLEPGTNWFVHKDESDAKYSLLLHPQNYAPETRVERVALKWAFAEVPLSIGTIVSADKLGLGEITSVGEGVSVGVSVGTGTSVRLDFTRPINSQYYILVFPGI